MEAKQPRANLLKVSKSEYINEMYDQEYLFLSQHKSFRGSDPKNNGIKDPREQNVTTLNGKKVSVSRKDGKPLFYENELILSDGELNESIEDVHTLICSFYYLGNELEEPNELYQEKFYQPGNLILIIKDLKEFKRKFRESMAQLNMGFENKMVEYYDPKTWRGGRDSLTVHHKDIGYSYQSEFRVAIRPLNYGEPGIPPLMPMKVPLPGLRQISYTREIYSGFQ